MNPILRRFSEIAQERGARSAILLADGTVARTFRQIDEAANRWGEAFAGDRGVVAIQIGNSPAWPELLLSAWRAGWCVLPLDPDLAGERRDKVEAACGVTLRIGRGEAEIQAVKRDSQAPVAVVADLLKLTSGTTGDPRAIRFTAAQLLADCENICESMGLREDDLNYGLVSFSHSYGFSNLVTPLLCRGISLVAAADAMPRAVVNGLATTGATVLPGVPAHFRTLSAMSPGQGRLRLCISAGAPLTREIAGGFGERWHRKVHSFYGASECGGICYDAGAETELPSGYVGSPLDGVVVTLLDSGSEPSRISVRSEAVGLGYFPEEEADLAGGEFRPADLLQWTGEGYVIAGRVSDSINVAGRKVNPAEIEAVLRSCPGVSDAVVLGVPAGLRGEEIAACVAGSASEEALRGICAMQLAVWQIPRQWHFFAEIPTNSRGKVSRADLRRVIVG